MSITDRILYFGVWGGLAGFALYYGWRIVIGIVGPAIAQLAPILLGDTEFDPILIGSLFNEATNIISGLVVALVLAIVIRLVIRPASMAFAAIPSIVLLVLSYEWLVRAAADGSMRINSDLLMAYVPGPLLVLAVFLVVFRFIAITRHGASNEQAKA
jgi:hypothetical protein